ncbi:hypothetical protein PENPOL_c001G04524 [Penicillium polonicum]|uniref:Uncharacterized protein n=1 Tax=Penicillium polonicum TaxID=60169 RepID=A0A1V6P6J1_PENPO|nr:hypothetical protein PENPOL_c001G04524 [Penicillium polonicum]
MKAIVIEKFGGPESLVIKDVPILESKQGEVGEWAEWMPISGTERVSTVSTIQEESLKKALLSQVSWAALDVLLTVATLNIPESESQMLLHSGQLQKNYGWQPSQHHMLWRAPVSFGIWRYQLRRMLLFRR